MTPGDRVEFRYETQTMRVWKLAVLETRIAPNNVFPGRWVVRTEDGAKYIALDNEVRARRKCCSPDCTLPGVWQMIDTLDLHCEAHSREAHRMAEDREDFAAEYASDAARELDS